MLVCMYGSFKAPVAHYLVDDLNAEEKAQLIKDLLTRLHKSNINVQGLTFDGASDQINACSLLGAQFDI